MKTTKLLHTLLLALFATHGAGAQTLLDGAVRIDDAVVTRAHDKLFVSMEIDLGDLRLGSDREVLLTPRITAGELSAPLPAVTVAGRNR